MSAKRAPTLAERLARRRDRVAHYDFPTVDTDVVEERVSALNKARQASVLAALAGDDAAGERARASAEKAERAAREALRACFDRVEFRGLDAVAQNALLNEVESRDGNEPHTFTVALLAASCGDPSMGEAEWDEARRTWPRPEWDAAVAACDTANRQAGSAGIPKD